MFACKFFLCTITHYSLLDTGYTKFLKNCKRYTTEKKVEEHCIMLQLYYAIVHPFLYYGIIIWGATYPIYVKRLKSLQNRAIRAVARCHYRNEVKLFYNQSKILQIDDLLKYEIAKFVHCNTTNKTPNSFRNYFCKIAEHSSRVTRQSSDNSNLYISRYRSALNIRESRSGIPYLKKLGCYLIKDLKFSIKIFC